MLETFTSRPQLVKRLRNAGATVADLYPTPARPLAVPPHGSGLKPVMGAFGPPGIGIMLSALANPLDSFSTRAARFGSVQWFGMLGRRAVGVSSPDSIETVLLDRDKVFSAQRGWEFLIGPFFRGGLLLRDFDEHRYHRRIMQQAFTRPRLIGYLELTTPAIQRALDSWEPGSRFALYDSAKQLLLDLAAEVFLGTELGPEAKRLERAFEDAVHGGQALIRTPLPGGAWARGLQGRKRLQQYFRRELPAKRAGAGSDLFSVLCRMSTEEGHAFADEDIVDHLIFLMMAAHDTSTLTLSMLAYELARHPEWQERLRAESLALGKPTLDYADLDRLPSLDLAFRETLRLYSPVGLQLREALRDTEITGHYIPAGTLIFVATYPAMQVADVWPNPAEFDPERFGAERHEDKVHRYAWTPFGGGAHKCIGLYFGGMTVKAIIHQMLLRYRWDVPAGYRVPLGWATGPVPIDGLPIRLEPIEKRGAAPQSNRRTA